jgi:hypothetical protein
MGKIIIFYILIFVFREETGREDTLKRMVGSIRQIYSVLNLFVKVISVTSVHKYSNFAAFSKDLLAGNCNFVLHFADETHPDMKLYPLCETMQYSLQRMFSNIQSKFLVPQHRKYEQLPWEFWLESTYQAPYVA